MKTISLLYIFLPTIISTLIPLDTTLTGTLRDISDNTLPVLSLAANLTVKPVNMSSADVDNSNNAILKALNTTQIVSKLNVEIALRLKELDEDNNFLNLKTGFDQLKERLDGFINLTLSSNDCNDPTLIDLAQVSRNHLRALLSRYRNRKLGKYLQWYTYTNNFRLKRVTIRDLRVQIIDTLKNASELIDSTVKGGCVGLNLLGVLCIRNNVISLINLIPLINNILSPLLNIQSNLNNLAATYNNDLALIQSFFTNVDPLDDDDNLEYQYILDALQRKRNFLLPTWEEAVSNLKGLLDEVNLVTLKGRVRKLLVGWKFGNNDNTLTLNKLTNINPLNKIIRLEFVVNLVKDTACACAADETIQKAAVKLQSAIKTVLQTSCLLDRINVEDAVVDTTNIARVLVLIREYEIENNYLVNNILSKANIVLPDPSTYQAEFNAFVANLTEPDTRINASMQLFNNLRNQIKNENNAINNSVVVLIGVNADLDFSASLELSNFTANITTLVQFTQRLVNRYALFANSTIDGLKSSSDFIGKSVKEALTKIEILKYNTFVAAAQLKNATDTKAKNALNITVENLKTQILETFKDREVKRQCYVRSNEVTNEGYNRAGTQHLNLIDNLQSIISNKRKRLQDIKEKIKQNYQDFEDSIKIAIKSYRPLLVNISVIAGADLNNNDDVSLYFEVRIEDSTSGESNDERKKAHTYILRGIFAVMTTDVNVSVTTAPNNIANNDVYNVRSLAPIITPVPVVTPTVFTPTNVPVITPILVPVAIVPVVTPTVVPVVTPTVVPVVTPTIDITPTLVPVVTPTIDVTPTLVPVVTPTIDVTPTVVPVVTPTTDITPTLVPVITPTIIPDITPTLVPVVTPTIVPVVTPTIDITPTLVPVVTPTIDVTPTLVPVITPTLDVIPTIVPVVTPVTIPDITPTPVPIETPTPTPTPADITPSPVPVATPTPVPNIIPTPVPIATPTETPTPVPDVIPTPVPVMTPTEPTIPTPTPDVIPTPIPVANTTTLSEALHIATSFFAIFVSLMCYLI